MDTWREELQEYAPCCLRSFPGDEANGGVLGDNHYHLKEAFFYALRQVWMRVCGDPLEVHRDALL